jgi:hypothetical protein
MSSTLDHPANPSDRPAANPREACWIAFLLAAGGLPAVALPGASSADYTILPMTLAGGGGHASSDNYEVFGTIETGVTGAATSADYSARYGFVAASGPLATTGRFVFYNQSFWDGNNAAATANDDFAIATDKRPLFDGETATFANYTSYSRGLNGLMVDLPLAGTPTAADFAFRRGNTDTPAAWEAAPAPSTIAVRPGAGRGGADRVTLIWPNNAIQKQWLQVTVLATPNTGLSEPDVFYFGNAIGETGNSTTDARVTGSDALRILNNITLVAGVTNRFDINRDSRVAAADRLLVLANTSALNPLRLITPGGGAALADAEPPAVPAVPAVELEPTAEGLRARWISPGRPLRILFSDEVGAARWEPLAEAGGATPEGEIVEILLPPAPEGPARFYRFEAPSGPPPGARP